MKHLIVSVTVGIMAVILTATTASASLFSNRLVITSAQVWGDGDNPAFWIYGITLETIPRSGWRTAIIPLRSPHRATPRYTPCSLRT